MPSDPTLPGTTESDPVEDLHWLAREARGFRDPVCDDDVGNACSWALAEIGQLRLALGLHVPPTMAIHVEGNPFE